MTRPRNADRPATAAEARAIFRAQRALFARAHPHVARVPLRLVASRCPTGERSCAARDLAWMDGDGVHLLRRALALPASRVRALLAHELGHAADLRRHEDGSEQRADDLAEAALGRRVRYDRRDVQTFGPGAWPRPRRLHS